MSNNYKFKRDWENAEKAIYDGEGEFDIPVIMPEEYHNVEWIGFNKARATQNRENKGVHFFLDDYQFVRLWKNIDRYVDLLKSYDFVMSQILVLIRTFLKLCRFIIIIVNTGSVLIYKSMEFMLFQL